VVLSLTRKTKELWKCVDGKFSLIAKVEDGGYIQNAW